jgi:methylenetetrahydrofolate dehydrogenase (NADP+) / methenyltetrahydrofolate cyclohydrolase
MACKNFSSTNASKSPAAAFVVGASNIVGKPTALMLMQRHATVSICHKKTRDLGQYTLLADILVVAAGVPNLIVPQMVRTGAVVIDVGINRLPDGRIIGDVDFDGVSQKASYITPVPGGVGPMTVTMLLYNTLLAAENAA